MSGRGTSPTSLFGISRVQTPYPRKASDAPFQLFSAELKTFPMIGLPQEKQSDTIPYSNRGGCHGIYRTPLPRYRMMSPDLKLQITRWQYRATGNDRGFDRCNFKGISRRRYADDYPLYSSAPHVEILPILEVLTSGSCGIVGFFIVVRVPFPVRLSTQLGGIRQPLLSPAITDGNLKYLASSF